MDIEIENIDFIDLYKWLWKRHETHKLSPRHFFNSTDTYCGLIFGGTPNSDINQRMIVALTELGFLKKHHAGIGLRLSLVRDDELIQDTI